MMKKRITQEKEEVVLIQETKCDKTMMLKITKKIWNKCEVAMVDSKGASSGIAILWDPMKWNLESVSTLPRILMMSFEEIGSQAQGFISNAYGSLTP
jgi:hypothetical protein